MRRIPLQAALVGLFAVIVVVALAAVDYTNQARRADGRFGLAAWAGSITGRFGDLQAAREAERLRRELRSVELRELLPEPAGWTRRDWTEADEALLDPRYDMQSDAAVPGEMKTDPVLATLVSADRATARRRDRAGTYVYERRGEIVALRLTRVETGGGVPGMAMSVVQANLGAMSTSFAYAMVGGVAFRDARGLFWMSGEAPGDRVAVISGRIGEELWVTARAMAGDEAILDLLQAIDYDRLNAVLDAPVDEIGNDQPVLDPQTSRLLAEAAIARDDAQMQAAAAAAMARLEAIGSAESRTEALALVLAGIAGIEDAGERKAWIRAAEAAAEPEAGGQPGGGLFSRIGGFLTGGGDAEVTPVQTAETAAPRSFTCVSDRGFKRCSAAD